MWKCLKCIWKYLTCIYEGLEYPRPRQIFRLVTAVRRSWAVASRLFTAPGRSSTTWNTVGELELDSRACEESHYEASAHVGKASQQLLKDRTPIIKPDYARQHCRLPNTVRIRGHKQEAHGPDAPGLEFGAKEPQSPPRNARCALNGGRGGTQEQEEAEAAISRGHTTDTGLPAERDRRCLAPTSEGAATYHRPYP
jgi:hypothetical protein